MTMMTSAPISQPSQSSTSSELFKGFSSLSSRLTSGFKEAGIGANLENLISGVKNFLPQDRDLTLTKITESLMDPQNASSAAIARTEHYLYFDPRSANARGQEIFSQAFQRLHIYHAMPARAKSMRMR